jgi:hypothetical protein
VLTSMKRRVATWKKAFGAPRQDAAARCALEIQAALAELNR